MSNNFIPALTKDEALRIRCVEMAIELSDQGGYPYHADGLVKASATIEKFIKERASDEVSGEAQGDRSPSV